MTENPPVRLTRSVRQALTRVSCGGAEAYVWPGGGITVMADVMEMPSNAFGYVPTPAIVAPIEFTMRVSDYAALGGHIKEIRAVDTVVSDATRKVGPSAAGHDPQRTRPLPLGGKMSFSSARLSGGDRLHLQHGPIDLVIGADGARGAGFCGR